MTETSAFLANRLSVEGTKVHQFFLEISPDDWGKTIYTEGGRWNVSQVLAHLVATELALQELIENILGGGEGASPDFDIDQFNESHVAELHSISEPELLARFLSHRQKTAQLVESLSPDDLQKQGRHPFLGMTPLVEIIKLVYRHTQIHQREIRKSLSAL